MDSNTVMAITSIVIGVFATGASLGALYYSFRKNKREEKKEVIEGAIAIKGVESVFSEKIVELSEELKEQIGEHNDRLTVLEIDNGHIKSRMQEMNARQESFYSRIETKIDSEREVTRNMIKDLIHPIQENMAQIAENLSIITQQHFKNHEN